MATQIKSEYRVGSIDDIAKLVSEMEPHSVIGVTVPDGPPGTNPDNASIVAYLSQIGLGVAICQPEVNTRPYYMEIKKLREV